MKSFSFRNYSNKSDELMSIPRYLLSTDVPKVTELKNGILVVTQKTMDPTIAMSVSIDAGSSYETDEINGASNFLQRMSLKGTKSRTMSSLDSEIENMGARLIASTDREQVTYLAHMFEKDVSQMSELVGDMIQNPRLEISEIEKEAQLLLKEKRESENNQLQVINDYLHAAAYQGSSLGRTVIGTTKTIPKLSADDLLNYSKTHYSGNRIVVSAAGPIDHNLFVELTNKNFGSLPVKTDFDFSTVLPEYTGSEIKVRDDTMHEVTAAIAFQTVSWSDPDFVTFMVIQNLIGVWDSSMGGGSSLNSRLSEVSSTDNLAYSFNTFNYSYHNTGLFGINFVSPYDRVDIMTIEVMNEFSMLRSITKSELERAKDRLKAQYIMQSQGNTSISLDNGRQMLTLRRCYSITELYLRIDAVTVDDVIGVSWKYLHDVDPVVSAVGPIKYFPDYGVWRSRTSR